MDFKHAVCIATVALQAIPALAVSPAEREQQVCSERLLALADTFLQDGGKRQGNEDIQPPFASACKAWPGKEPYTLGVFVYDGLERDTKRLLVALFEQASGKVAASYWASVPSDPIETYSAGTRIDTARYQVTPDLRAFGVDFSTEAPRYQYGGYGPMRTLFVREGTVIRPILSGMALSRWSYVGDKGPWDLDENGDPVPEPDITRFNYTISIAATRSKGYADLLIARKANFWEAKPQTQLLHYDGKQYPVPHE